MAKLLVLFDGLREDTADVAGWIHEGARSVRFAEADLMRLPGDVEGARLGRIRSLPDVEALVAYDAIAIGASPEGLERCATLLREAEALGIHGKLANKLGSVFPHADPDALGDAHPLWSLLAPMARYGMILVPPGYRGPTGEAEGLEAGARRLGKRLIDIAGWITHARSHHHH
jgi:hypothetical protein